MTDASTKMSDWVDRARKELLALRKPDSGWAYQPDAAPSVEPTALACLALLSTQNESGSGSTFPAVAGAAKWLASLQKPDGSTGISAALAAPGWPTTYAILVWANQGSHPQEVGKATEWLIRARGNTFPQESKDVVGTDSTIAGWSWVEGTYSWLEPTAMAVLALRRQGLQGHSRAQDGLRLIGDRAIASGGWNIGCNTVYGKNLVAQPSETGIALMALSGLQQRDGMVERACSYLQRTLPGVRSAQSLCWGLLGLAAWGLRPPEADQWLEQAYGLVVRRPHAAAQLAYLLLASSDRSLVLLGVKP
jgi:hypothetical protein